MVFRKFLACLLPLLAGAAHAQDMRSVVSPDGQLEFRLFTTVPAGAQLNSVAYQVWLRGKSVIDTSCLGLNIHFQEPLLGENVGLSWAKPLQEAAYNGLIADYLQTSSTGRRIRIEVRVWNDGVAFRYLVPEQTPMAELLIEDEATEFHFAHDGQRPAQTALPYSEPIPGGGWLGIFETRVPGLPRLSLVQGDGPQTLVTHLRDKPNDPAVAFEGTTPWTGPWRIVAFSQDRDRLAQSTAVQTLSR